MNIKQITNNEFIMFADSFKDKSIYQLPEYAFVMNNQNYSSMLLGMVDENNNIVAASLILIEEKFKFKYAYAPKGFLIDYNNTTLLNKFTKNLKIFLGKLDIIAVKLCPMIVKSIDGKETDEYDEIFKFLKKEGYYHLGYNNFFESLKPRYEAILDINKPYYELFNNLRKEFRTKVRSADKNGIRVYKGTKEDLEYLYLQTEKKYPRDLKYFQDLYDFYNKRGLIDFFYAKLDTKYYLELTQKSYSMQEEKCNIINQLIIVKSSNKNANKYLNQKMHNDLILDKLKKQLIRATDLLREYPEGIVIASVLIIKQNNQVNLVMDGFNAEFKKLNAKHLLIWKLIERYSKLNFLKFNLGGITNPEINDNKYKGLNDFKLGFGSKAYEYLGDLELVTNKTLYFMYRNSAPIRNILKK